jgi:hypothetical protein
MRRVVLQEGTSVGVYHCMSRICNKGFRFDKEEKAVVVWLVRGMNGFVRLRF